MQHLKRQIEIYKAMNDLAKAGLDVSLAKHFRYARVRGNKLFLTFNMDKSYGRFEFSKKKDEIKTRMRQEWVVRGNFYMDRGISFSDIEAVFIKEPVAEIVQRHYPIEADKSQGKFENRCKNESLRLKFEEIRGLIKGEQ